MCQGFKTIQFESFEKKVGQQGSFFKRKPARKPPSKVKVKT